MTDKLKKIAASIIIPRLNVLDFLNDFTYKQSILKLIDSNIAGFCVFQGSIEQAKTVIQELRNYSPYQLIFSGDYEHGLPMRHQGGTSFPHAMALGKTKDRFNTFIQAQLIGKELKSIGIDWNLAPVCDINNNPKNPIINIRSFGDNAELVANHSVSYIKGLHEQGIASCAKHFPGHGNTEVDSHLSLPIINITNEELYKNELIPFIEAIKNNVNSIMIGHLAIPALESDVKIPASLSKNVVDFLKNDLNYSGLIITDALDMKGISNTFTQDKALEMCLNAGIDILLMPENANLAIEHVSQILENDSSLLEQVSQTISKINDLKKWLSSQENNNIHIDVMQHEKIAFTSAMAATELKIKNDEAKTFLPFNNSISIAGFSFLQKDEDFQSASQFYNLLGTAIENNIDFGFLNDEISDQELIDLRESIKDAEILVFSYFYRARAFYGNIGIADKLNEITRKLAFGRPVINVFFGNPYLDEEIYSDLSILTFSDSLASIASAVVKLSGVNLPNDDNASSLN